MADWNWRDEFEEKDKYSNTVVFVNCPGRPCYVYTRYTDGELFTGNKADLIPKPKPKIYRPWTRDEVPVGAVVVHKDTGSKWLITGSGEKIYVCNEECNRDALLQNWTLLDGSPCGVGE